MNSKITVLSLIGVAALVLAVWSIVSAPASASTYVFSGLLVLTVGVIIMNTVSNAHPARSMGRLVHDKAAERPSARRSL